MSVSLLISPSNQEDNPPARKERRIRSRSAAPWCVLGISLVLWVFSLTNVSLENLGPWGLIPALPISWYAALALTAATAVWGLVARPQPAPRLMAASVGLLIAVLYATMSFVEEAPRLAWMYKHIGVTQYIAETGSVNPSIDIYHRWPGSFAFGGYLDSLFGISNPTSYAAWLQPLFAAVFAVLVFSLARMLSSSPRAAWAAVLLFTGANWTGQLYYAPQPLAFAMHLGILLLVLRYFRSSPNKWGRKLEGLLAKRGVTDSQAAEPREVSASASRVALACLLLMHFVSTESHQLTPFMTLLAVGVMTMLGYVRPRWLIFILAAISIVYLMPNLIYVIENYGLFTLGGPIDNFQSRLVAPTEQLPVKATLGALAPAITLLVGLLGAAGIWVRWRRGGQQAALMVALLLATPLFLGFVQSYGGEAQLRAALFALPWCAIGAGWLVSPALKSMPRWKPVLAIAGAFTLLLALFVPAFFGNEDVYYVPASEVEACEWLSHNSPANSVYLQSVSGFPVRCTASYNRHVGPGRGDTPTLLSYDDRFALREFLPAPTVAEKQTVYNHVRSYGKETRLIFSTSQQRYARAWGIFGDGGYERLENALAADPRFKIVFRNADTRVYTLTPEAELAKAKAAAETAARGANAAALPAIATQAPGGS